MNKIRLFERQYRFEYTKYEFKRKQEIYDAKIKHSMEVIGYVVYINERFLIVPTLTALTPYVICVAECSAPPDRSLIRAYGRWDYGINNSVYDLFIVQDYEVLRSDPEVREIDYHTFREILFPDLSEDTSDIIAHALVGSPYKVFPLSIQGKRAHEIVKRIINILPDELINPSKLYIDELGYNLTLDPLSWSFQASYLKAPRINNSKEVTLFLYNDTISDLDISSEFMPVIIDTLDPDYSCEDPYEVLKFLISAHNMPVRSDTSILKHIRDGIREYFEVADERVIDNWSKIILRLALSEARIKMRSELTISEVNQGLKLFDINMNHILAQNPKLVSKARN